MRINKTLIFTKNKIIAVKLASFIRFYCNNTESKNTWRTTNSFVMLNITLFTSPIVYLISLSTYEVDQEPQKPLKTLTSSRAKIFN